MPPFGGWLPHLSHLVRLSSRRMATTTVPAIITIDGYDNITCGRQRGCQVSAIVAPDNHDNMATTEIVVAMLRRENSRIRSIIVASRSLGG